MKHILAIDAGGTKCAALLANPEGMVQRAVFFQKHGRTARDPSVVSGACQAVLEGQNVDNLLVAFTSPVLPSVIAARVFNRSVNIKGVYEYMAALRLADETHGLIVLAGTGAFVHVQPESGEGYHLDGSGPLVGDFGAGFWIGQQALRAMIRCKMHKRHFTTLDARIRERLSIGEINKIAFFDITANDRMTIASLAKTVDQEAQAGDRISSEILRAAAHELAITVFDALDRRGLQNTPMPLVGTGSVLCNSEILWDFFVNEVKGFAPGLHFVRLSEYPAVAGVALDGVYDKFDTEAYRGFRKNLLRSIHKAMDGETK